MDGILSESEQARVFEQFLIEKLDKYSPEQEMKIYPLSLIPYPLSLIVYNYNYLIICIKQAGAELCQAQTSLG